MVVLFVCFYLIFYIMYSYCYVYVFLLLCMFRSRYCVSLCGSVYFLLCKCVMYYFHRLSIQLQLTNISKQISNIKFVPHRENSPSAFERLVGSFCVAT